MTVLFSLLAAAAILVFFGCSKAGRDPKADDAPDGDIPLVVSLPTPALIVSRFPKL